MYWLGIIIVLIFVAFAIFEIIKQKQVANIEDWDCPYCQKAVGVQAHTTTWISSTHSGERSGMVVICNTCKKELKFSNSGGFIGEKPQMKDIVNLDRSIEDYEIYLKDVQEDINLSNAEKSKLTWEIKEKIKELKKKESTKPEGGLNS